MLCSLAAKQGGKKTKNARANQEMDVTMAEMDTSFDENETRNSAFDDDEEAPAKGGSKGLSSVASSEKVRLAWSPSAPSMGCRHGAQTLVAWPLPSGSNPRRNSG